MEVIIVVNQDGRRVFRLDHQDVMDIEQCILGNPLAKLTSSNCVDVIYGTMIRQMKSPDDQLMHSPLSLVKHQISNDKYRTKGNVIDLSLYLEQAN